MNRDSRIVLKKDTLWHNLVRATKLALHTRALLPMPTDYEFIEDGGIRFFVRILSSQQRKNEARRKQQEAPATEMAMNPFLPYEKALFVGDISGTHIALLNNLVTFKSHGIIMKPLKSQC